MLQLERFRDELKTELREMRALYDEERQKVTIAQENIAVLESDKRVVQDAVVQRGKEIRDLEENRDRLEDLLKAVEIERDTL